MVICMIHPGEIAEDSGFWFIRTKSRWFFPSAKSVLLPIQSGSYVEGISVVYLGSLSRILRVPWSYTEIPPLQKVFWSRMGGWLSLLFIRGDMGNFMRISSSAYKMKTTMQTIWQNMSKEQILSYKKINSQFITDKLNGLIAYPFSLLHFGE